MIDLTSADALDALALSIFNPEIIPSTNPALGDTWGKGVGLTAQNDAIDAQYYTLIAPVMLVIDGRTMPAGFKFSLNITYALQGRPKHWYLSLSEHDSSGYGWPASCALELHSTPGTVQTSVNSWGGTIGLATCACICHAWAKIIRMWDAGYYPLSVTPPPL